MSRPLLSVYADRVFCFGDIQLWDGAFLGRGGGGWR